MNNLLPSPAEATALQGAEIIQAAVLIARALNSGRVKLNPDSSVTVDGVPLDVASSLQGGEQTLAKQPANKFQFDGHTWTLQYEGKVVSEPNRVGLRYIKQLIQRARTEIHVTELVTSVYGEPVDVVPEANLLDVLPEANLLEDGEGNYPLGLVVAPEFQDEILPDEDRGYVLNLLEKAREELATIKINGQTDLIAEKEGEIEKIEDYLRSTRFGDRNAHFDGRADKDRKSVAKAIKEAIGKLADKHPALASHFCKSIKTGVFCLYEPETELNWEVAAHGRLVASNS